MPPTRVIDVQRILQVLPHRHPMVMVDRVTHIEAGKRVSGHKCVSFNEPWFAGHSPSRPVFPGVMILEALSQIGGVLAYASEPFDPMHSVLYFLGFEKVKFRRTVTPGDRLDLEVRVIHHRSNIWKLHGEASVEGTLAAEAELLASVVER